MKLRTRLLATASALTMFAGLGFIASAPAGAVVTFNVANDHATCNTLSGTIKFASHLKNSGPTTGSQTTTATIALAGCFDDDNNAVKMFKGATTAKLTSNGGWNCAGLLGPTTDNGSSDIVYTPGAGQAFTPKITVGTVQKSATHAVFTQVSGGTYSVTGHNPWTSAYGFFAIGTPFGTQQLTLTGEFTGGDTGVSAWFAGTTQQDIGYILTTCGTTAGVATLNFGNGAVHS